jgi:hypothetical protein
LGVAYYGQFGPSRGGSAWKCRQALTWGPELLTGGDGVEPIVIDGGKGTVVLGSDGVIHLVWKSNVSIDRRDSEAAMATVNEISGGSEYPMLVDMATTESVSRDARAVFSIPPSPARLTGSLYWARAQWIVCWRTFSSESTRLPAPRVSSRPGAMP